MILVMYIDKPVAFLAGCEPPAAAPFLRPEDVNDIDEFGHPNAMGLLAWTRRVFSGAAVCQVTWAIDEMLGHNFSAFYADASPQRIADVWNRMMKRLGYRRPPCDSGASTPALAPARPDESSKRSSPASEPRAAEQTPGGLFVR